eukprot:CAMPEP_0185034736 /NCGR_PEP_ID=MMETSP1103-20130426/24863_1 /TAXON_ID=36769 /ORGANISM="Paraphysomonas bandaiensis, Strain Caron Lab Isolate" /LENGTH=865 /DNA_ID=CAMNT_0027571513 /DNA_START=115 /DNA_END=2709 /DNA_ORIENTATION=-
MYCRVDGTTGAWRCSLCGGDNGSFHPNINGRDVSDELQVYPELSNPQVDFMESTYYASASNSANSAGDHIRIFVFDTTVCEAQGLKDFLSEMLECLSPSTRISIIAYGRNISLLRLCGGEPGCAVCVDVLPGARDCSALSHLYQQGEYTTTARNAVQCLSDIVGALQCLSDDTTGSKTCTATTASTLLKVVCSVAGEAAPGVHALLVAGRNIPVGVLQSEEDRLQSYARVGRDACIRGHCWVDALVVSMHGVDIDAVDALAGGSGGTVVGSGYSLNEKHLILSAKRCLSLPRSCFPMPFPTLSTEAASDASEGALVTVEVRTSPGITVDQITGPVFGVREDALDGRRSLLKDLIDDALSSGSSMHSSLRRLVDREHVRRTVEAIECSKPASGVVGTAGMDTDALHRELTARCVESDYISQCELMRLDPDTALSFVLEPGEALRGTEQAIVQIVVRYADRDSKVTKVMTSRLKCSEDVSVFLGSLDVDVWGPVVMRDIVGDLHASSDAAAQRAWGKQQQQEDPLAKLIQTTESVSVTAELDRLVKDLVDVLWMGQRNLTNADGWKAPPDCNWKVSEMCRALFHLREGPLLYGPSANPQESYLARSWFLSFTPQQFSQLVQPIVQVFDPSTCPPAILCPPSSDASQLQDTQPEGDSDLEEWVIMALDDVPADSLQLLPNLIAVIDLGDKMVVRVGRDIDSKYGSLISITERVVRRRIENRFPAPVYHRVREGSPQDRMVFARMNPSHRDGVDISLKRIPSLTSLEPGVLEDLSASMPYTDQKSYFQYISSLAPKFAVAVELDPSGGGDRSVLHGAPSSVQPMDRGGGTSSAPPHRPPVDVDSVINTTYTSPAAPPTQMPPPRSQTQY